MSPEAIRNAVVADPAIHALVPDTSAVAAALSAGRTKLTELQITERRIISVLGIVHGDAFLTALEEFSVSELDANHPFKLAQPGLRRALKWLKSEAGLDIGDPNSQALLSGLAMLGVLNATHAQAIMNIARVPDPIPEMDVRRALFADDGTQLIPPYIAPE